MANGLHHVSGECLSTKEKGRMLFLEVKETPIWTRGDGPFPQVMPDLDQKGGGNDVSGLYVGGRVRPDYNSDDPLFLIVPYRAAAEARLHKARC